MYTIYKITQISTGKVYIGQTSKSIEQRWKMHLSRAFNKYVTPIAIANAIKQYGQYDFTIGILDTTESRRKALQIEQYYISLYDSRNEAKGFNRDKIFTDTQRAKMSKAAKERPHQSFSAETRKKMRYSQPARVRILCIETGEVFESITHAAQTIGADRSRIRQVLQGKRKTVKHLTFKYLDN